MVSRTEFQEDTPIRVSPYRLCAHLGTAFTFLVGSLWTALDISMANRGGAASLPEHRLTRVLRVKSLALALFTFFVAMSGPDGTKIFIYKPQRLTIIHSILEYSINSKRPYIPVSSISW